MTKETRTFNLKPVKVPKVKTSHRVINTSIPVPESINILNRIEKFESSNVKDQLPVVWDRAEGFQIFDKWGNCWIDFTSTIFVTNSGHNHPKIINAIVGQQQTLGHAYSYATEIRSQYIEKLIKFVPGYLEKVSLYSAGTEATERAVKLARYYGKKFSPTRRVIVGWDGNYHGKTMGAQMISGQHADKGWIGELDPNIVHLPYPYPWVLEQLGITGKELFEEHLKILEAKNITAKNITAFMAETFQGWAAVFYPVDYIKELRKWTQENDILLIFDEIQSGFGRTGKLFGYEHYEIEPDLVCCGKGISGSLPLSAVLGRGDLIDLDPAYTSTHGGHPVACAAGLANIEVFIEENLVTEAARKEAILRSHADGWAKMFPGLIGDVFVKGMIMGVFIMKRDAKDRMDVDIQFCDQVVEKAMQKGLFLIRTGRGTLKLGPPLNIPDNALVEGLEVIGEVISELIDEHQH